MGKFWSIYFLVFGAICIGLFIVGPSMGWWFPTIPGEASRHAVSPLGRQIDDLFYLILAITGVTFIGVMVALSYILWKYGNAANPKGKFVHGNHTLEVVWSVVPAAILLFIAMFQMDVWARYRVKSNFDPKAMARPLAEVTARQFEWRIRYPAPGKVLQDTPQPDDLYTVNDLHAPVGRPVVIKLRSEEVLHSFFLPHLRVKQDAVPGLVIPVWFQADKVGAFDLVCAELCGWGHYKMRGQLSAQREEDFEAYLKDLQKKQFDDGYKAEEEVAAK